MEFIRQHQSGIMLFLEGICIIISFLVLITKNPSKSRKISIFLLEISCFFVMLSHRFNLRYEGTPGKIAGNILWVSHFISFLSVIVVLYSFNMYLKSLFKNEGSLNKAPFVLKSCDYILYVNFISLIISIFNGFYFTISSTNNYVRGKGRVLAYGITFAVLFLELICLICNYKRFSKRIRIPIFLFTLVPFASVAVQFLYQGIYFTNMTITGMAIILYVFEIQEMNSKVERAHRLEVEMLERYKAELERTVDERTRELRIANDKAEHLLLNILPEDIAHELTEHPDATISKKYPNVTVLFTDIVGFTKMSSNMTASEIVTMLNGMTSLFDDRAKREGIEKIKTIGDAYMAATGLTEELNNDGAVKMVRFARGLLEDVRKFNESSANKIQIRIGINSGELVAGVIGKTKFIYDVWGDTVNVASRMESTGEPMRIHVSETTHSQTDKYFSYSEPVKVEVKGKGLMNAFFI
ncbi:MAG: hypothetical protein K6E97_11045 [Treponema sp.]|nr:hypothetical protein [Treponema sp.]